MTAFQSPPEPKGLPLIGHVMKFAREPYQMAEWVNEQAGPVAKTHLLGNPVVWLTGPEVIEEALYEKRDVVTKSEDFEIAFGEGLLATSGEQWEYQRNSIMEFFNPSRIQSFRSKMVSMCESRCDWETGDDVFLLEEMQDLTLEILFETLFGMDVSVAGVDADLRRSVRRLDNWFRPTSWALPNWFPTPGRYTFRRASQRLNQRAEQLLADVRTSDETNMFSVLATQLANDESKLSKEEIRDQLRTFMFAGHDTTALAMTFSFHLLGTHDRVRERFWNELDDVLGGRCPTVENLEDLTVVENVIHETLRLHPPVFNIPRVATEDVVLGGYQVDRGTKIFVSPLAVQRSEQFWDDPLEWKPSRWSDITPQEKGYTYLPFGAGPRICIGRRFALVETKLVLSTLGQRYHLRPQTGLEVDPKMTGQPADKVPVTVECR